MEIINVKLKNREELIAELVSSDAREDKTYYLVRDPMQVESSSRGIAIRDYLYFSTENELWIDKDETMYVSLASIDAAEYYENYMRGLKKYQEEKAYSQMEMDCTEEDLKQAEEIVTAWLEGQGMTKH